jgi:hypothetical protein
LQTIQSCLDNVKNNKTLSVESTGQIDYEKIVKNHENFERFINEISFEEYKDKYTSMIEVKMEQGNDQDEKFNLLLKISKAISNPLVINTINSLLLE